MPQEKIRILHCIETISSGGVEQTRLTLAKGLDKEKYELKIICTWKGGAIAEALEKEGVELIPIGGFKHPFEWRKHQKVLKVIRNFRPHIIHGAIFEGMSMAAIGGKLGKVPVVILEETSDPQNRSKKANWLLRNFVKVADRIVAISPNVERYLFEKSKIGSSKIKQINNSAHEPILKNFNTQILLRKEYGLEDEDILVGFVGRLFNDHKRVTDLIEAVSYINSDQLKLIIVGVGKDEHKIKQKVEEFNIKHKIIFTGYQFDTSKFYHLMDIACFPSSREGFGLVAAEAMMHGLPVIATNVGGLQNVVVDQKTGFLVPPYNPRAIAEKLQQLISQPALRKQMGQAGYERAQKHYSAERYVKEVEDLYLSLLKKKDITL
ncbi:glycosyltransferase family 4 protein [Echinicola sp. 20G]|uniref:glycosyltransferase family 4 protein n=1 Tax=Echinicola sp. 20G TaxID=2781961 RepID=UPI0019107F09|nr:glycosyltransferase family 4 protein [Echinicola sp. 20G]